MPPALSALATVVIVTARSPVQWWLSFVFLSQMLSGLVTAQLVTVQGQELASLAARVLALALAGEWFRAGAGLAVLSPERPLLWARKHDAAGRESD